MNRADMEKVFGEGVAFEETKETVAFEASLSFSSDVIREMKHQGLTLKGLAERIGVSQPTLCRKLNGSSNLTLKSMAAMAMALGCEFEAPTLKAPETVSASEESPVLGGVCAEGTIAVGMGAGRRAERSHFPTHRSPRRETATTDTPVEGASDSMARMDSLDRQGVAA